MPPRAVAALGTILLTLALVPLPARAQVAIGASGGLSLSTLTGDDIGEDEAERRTGLLVGGFASVPLSEMISLTTGLYYVQKGAEDLDDVTLELDYLEVPLLLQVELFQNEQTAFSVFAGPAIAFEIGCEVGSGSMSVDCDSDVLEDVGVETQSLTVDAIVGAGVRVMTSETMFLLANAGLDLGLTSIDDSELDADVKNSSWFLQAGLGWIVGR